MIDSSMNDRKKILVVEDEPKILKVVEQTLRKNGFAVITSQDGEEALEKLAQEQPDLIILDLMLPKLDGYEVCRLARKQSPIPVIMLTAKADLVDKTVGFNLGVDDYVTKPFSPSELVLRVKAVLRRIGDGRQFINSDKDVLELGEIRLDFGSRQAFVRGQEVRLTAKEFELLGLFLRDENQVYTREQLLEKIWDKDYQGDINTVTVLIRRIREKIEINPAKPKHLVTVWGVGYKFLG